MDEAFAELGQQLERMTDAVNGATTALRAIEAALESFNERIEQP